MRHRYSHLDPSLLEALLAGMDLLRLFNQLILASGGDVEQVLEWMRQLQEQGYISPDIDLESFLQRLEEGQMVERDPRGRFHLSITGERQIRRSAFEEIFTHLQRGDAGYHSVRSSGDGTEPLPETRPYRFGDEVHRIDAIQSVKNALERTRGELELSQEDLEVNETEHLTSSATIVAIDVSYSMVFYGEDRITPAKKVALALTELITTKYPKDHLSVVLFGDHAEEVRLGDVAYIQAGPYHTNTRAALQMARGLLARRKQANKQIFLITDGHPTAIEEGNRVYRNPWSMDLKILNRTLEEAELCRRHKVIITTFMLSTEGPVVDFVEKMTKVNRGRAYFASPHNLSEFIFADYIRNRRKRVR